MKEYVKGTMRPEVLLGGWADFPEHFPCPRSKGWEELYPAVRYGRRGNQAETGILMDKHDTVGIDCVAMCVNDVACAGGEPLFFLDYDCLRGKNVPEKIATIVKAWLRDAGSPACPGLAEKQQRCRALSGG